MKKIGTVFLCLLAALALWASSFEAGKRHAIEDSVMYIVEFEDPDVYPEFDTLVYIELDNITYSHGMYVG